MVSPFPLVLLLPGGLRPADEVIITELLGLVKSFPKKNLLEEKPEFGQSYTFSQRSGFPCFLEKKALLECYTGVLYFGLN
jgi:hypothetical protein